MRTFHPLFSREFLNVSTRPLFQPAGRAPDIVEKIRAQWDDLLSLPLMVIPVEEINHLSGMLAFDETCPAADTWYVAAALHSHATL